MKGMGTKRYKHDPNSDAVVYALQMVEHGSLIKVGWTKNLKQRMIALFNIVPFKMRLLGVLSDKRHVKERNIHALFTNCRVHNEWFLPTEELLNFIKRHFKPTDISNEIVPKVKAYKPIAPEKPIDGQILYSPENAAYLLGLSVADAYRLAQSNSIDYHLADGEVRFLCQDVICLVNRRKSNAR